MDIRWLLIALHETKGVGRKSISRMISDGLLTEEMMEWGNREWEAQGFQVEISKRLVQNLSETALLMKQKEKECDPAVQTLTLLDQDYPAMLKESPDPPHVLYARGNIGLFSSPAIAMVGTRVPTAYGKKMGEMLARGLCEEGLTVISGLARGIDSICHEAALLCGGGTIAVMATGMDIVYPPENRSLFIRMAKDGLVITEYPPGTKPHPGLFPQRNRIIAGLSLGTLVVEADERSGSLITADAALDAGRDVFAVPGQVTSPKSRGALHLIRQGAKMVCEAADILEEYDSWLPKGLKNTYNRERQVQEASPCKEGHLTTDELRLYHILEQGPFTLDELLQHSRWDFGHLHSVLLSLIIKKQITQLPGAIYKTI
ncbi:DNA-protecting protein DprA [Paenibacillus sp. HJL G12]|uniref:DNA-protecting protein DprA n=1 Tax=Paenibacillus dendrobii TaxID=2691084 RepID=A0A7X3IHR6_9BACL|nr:DNA-processing protein DprA [Paenibacillus dendrobii]MWV43561.1 DNA-protecting protein DprA [Paenibacillus dendrobii]